MTKISRRGETHLVAVLSGEVTKRDRQMRLADAGGTEKDHVLGAFDEGQAGEFVDLLARRAGREAEVEAVERLDGRKAGDAREHLARPGPSRVTLGTQDRFEEIGERGLFRRHVLSHHRVEISNRAQPQCATQVSQALMLQNGHDAPAKTS